MTRAHPAGRTNSLQKAELRGSEARALGQPKESCPYQPAHGAKSGFIVAYRNAWMRGWEADAPACVDPEIAIRAMAYRNRVQKIRQLGSKAARNGMPESACPYRSSYRDEWIKGYRAQAWLAGQTEQVGR